jgi:hypothetical protein
VSHNLSAQIEFEFGQLRKLLAEGEVLIAVNDSDILLLFGLANAMNKFPVTVLNSIVTGCSLFLVPCFGYHYFFLDAVAINKSGIILWRKTHREKTVGAFGIPMLFAGREKIGFKNVFNTVNKITDNLMYTALADFTAAFSEEED